MAVAFPLVIRAFGLTLRDGWGLLSARHHALLAILIVAPLILTGLAVVRVIMHELGGVLERKAREHTQEGSPEEAA
jgi:hypothetical protein